MKTDRELLELAAKAIGCSVIYNETYGTFDIYQGDTEVKFNWDPLADYDDALQLGLKMEFCVELTFYDEIRVDSPTGHHWTIVPDDGVGRTADVCRAIVCCAAAIGETI